MSQSWVDAIDWPAVLRSLLKLLATASVALGAERAVSPPQIEQVQCAEVIRQTILWCESTRGTP